MKMIFGVNSTAPANERLKNGYTLYDWVMRQNCFPSFWMRTLTGKNVISEDEIEFLREKDCKIGLVIRDLTEVQVSSVNGAEDALRAIEAAKMLGVPQNKGIVLFAEIKPEWSVHHNWMMGFADVLVSDGYVPGFIGNTDSSDNFNFDRQCSHYVQATAEVNQFGAIYCATEPKMSEIPDKWCPYCPSALEPEDMHLWECGRTTFGELAVDDIYARDTKVVEQMW